MIKTLKITGFLAVLAAGGCVAMLVMFGLRGDPDMQKILASESIVEIFKKKNTKASSKNDQISPLVKQAKALALRINPPPKPKPVAKKPTKKTRHGGLKKAPTPKAAKVNSKFKLVATCNYADQPEKSMALLDMPAKGLKWYRQGQEVNHLVIQQVNDGNIVLYKNGVENSVATMPVINKKSLLKSDSNKQIDAIPQLPENSNFPMDIFKQLTDQAQQQEENETPKPPATRSRSMNAKKVNARAARKTRTLPQPKPQPEPKPETISKEEAEDNLQNTINNITRIISENDEDDQSQKDTNETFRKLLETLKAE